MHVGGKQTHMGENCMHKQMGQ